MRHVIFENNTKFKLAILIKERSLNKTSMEEYYLNKLSIDNSDVIGFSLSYNSNNKAPAKLKKEYVGNLLRALDSLEVTTLYVCDTEYFKSLAGITKAEPHLGAIMPCAIKGYEHMNVILGYNYSGIFYNPKIQDKLDLSLRALESHNSGNFTELGSDIVKSIKHLTKYNEIKEELTRLLDYPELQCDVETFSLKHYDAGLATVGFSWDKHNGTVIECDMGPNNDEDYFFGKRANTTIRNLLKWFFMNYKGKLIYHNASYDIKVIIYTLWMEDIIDQVGMLDGLEVMTRSFECTKTIAYLATNSCEGNELGLKTLAHEFTGKYAEDDINDIRLIPIDKLVKYNLIDCLATKYVLDKYYPILIRDNQEQIYLEHFKPYLKDIIQMELTGMPMCMDKVKFAKSELLRISNKHLASIMSSEFVEEAVTAIKLKKYVKDYLDRVGKAKNPHEIRPKRFEQIKHEFNPGSGPQVAILLYKVLGLPIIDTTDTGLPATGAKEIKKLSNHTDNQKVKDLINDLRGFAKADKILSTFIPVFEGAKLGPDGIYYLFGNFNLGGTKSGRLSSSGPNLQNIPSGSTYGKLIKDCFMSLFGWVFCGADFASLEDYVSALTTEDKNKLKVYLEGYCGHCLRAYAYFKDQMPDIVDTVESINSIATVYPDLRQESKAPTFALTYQGMWKTLMNNLGWSEEKAKRIENNFKDLYSESIAWVNDKLVQASEDGYITGAFGLRLRTPVLAKSILNAKSTPYQASKEGRTAGNALGQSYGLLTNRAASEFMERVRNSRYRYDVRLSAMIHDAIYLMVRQDLDVITWVNKNLTECMAWQDLPELEHDQVKIHANLALFYPSWKYNIELPADASRETIKQLCKGK